MKDKLIQELIRQHYMSGIGRLMRGVAHNVNGPLQVLSIQIELLKKLMAEEGKMLADLGALSFSGESGKLLKNIESKQEICAGKVGQLGEELERLHGMMDFVVNRCSASKESNTSMVDLNEVIKDEVIFLHADLFFKHKVKKTLKLRESVPLISDRYPDLSQALNHILQNAIEAVIDAEEREIIIETGLNGDNVFIYVQDTGCGIPPSAQEKLFAPFYTTKSHPHPGLGLFLTKKILEPLRAKFKVESEPGMTRVAVFFPYKKKEKR